MGGFAALALAWLAIVGGALVARIEPWRTARAAFIAVPFMLAAVPLIFTRTGESLGTVALGPLVLTIGGEGLREFATIALKSWVSVQAALLLAFTTPFHDLVEGLRRLRLPRIMVAIMSFMYRYLGVLTDEATRMLRARASRSADPGTGRAGGTLAWRAAGTGHLVGSLFLRAYERSERVHAAMLARGFEGDIRHLEGPRPSGLALAAFIALVAALVAFELAAHAWLPRL